MKQQKKKMKLMVYASLLHTIQGKWRQTTNKNTELIFVVGFCIYAQHVLQCKRK
jgi:hypothetical protein